MIGAGGIGLASATGGAIAYLNSGETIVEYITKKDTTKKKQFITLVADAHTALKNKYSSGNQNKPKKGNKEVGKEEIINWCKEMENTKFSKETDKDYSLINTWCFVNTSTLLEEAKRNNKTDINGASGDTEEWKKAWDSYNTNKGTSNLTISESAPDGLNNGDRNKGGPALYNWCKAQESHKMYEENFESIYKKYEKWCFASS